MFPRAKGNVLVMCPLLVGNIQQGISCDFIKKQMQIQLLQNAFMGKLRPHISRAEMLNPPFKGHTENSQVSYII